MLTYWPLIRGNITVLQHLIRARKSSILIEEEKNILESRIMVIFPIIGGGAIGSFGVHRFMNGELALALFDGVVALAFFALSLYTYLTGKDRLVRYVSAFISAVGPLILLNNFNSAGYYWVYSSSIVVFYLLSYPWAIALNIFMIGGVWFIHNQHGESSMDFASFVVTVALINLFSLFFSLNEARSKAKLREMSMTDDMTGVGNRRAFIEKVHEALSVFHRYERKSCLIYLDIDRFKEINDSLGHAMGDHAIKQLALFITAILRETDHVFRIGGDEFVIIVEGTDEENAYQLSEKIRSSVETEAILPDRPITVSLGVTMLREDDTVDTWIARADAGLYTAKQQGRNTVTRDRFQNVG